MAEYEDMQQPAPESMDMPEVDVIVEIEPAPASIPIIKFMGMDNIAVEIEPQELKEIGIRAKEDFETDLASMDEWIDNYQEALKMAKQVREKKTFPWINASNVKVPLIGQAAMNFNARAYPEIVQGDKVVKAKVVGGDKDEAKANRAERISKHMSYQLLDEMPNWERDTDKLLIMLPIIGTMFREVGWDETNQRAFIDLLLPDELIVNYEAKSLELEECRRISRPITLFKNDIKDRERDGRWLELNYTTGDAETAVDGDSAEPIEEDEQYFVQQLRYEDLDGDGYDEPYMVTFLKSTGDVVRITANYDADTVSVDEETGEVLRVRPYPIYTDYHFIPSFDGNFYSTGFGSYLYPINSSIDTIINQLIDAGTLSNVQGGFLGKGLRSKMGATPLQPGEWRPLDSKGGDLKNNIVPLPAKEASSTLFNMLVMLIDMGKEMSSITDVMSGVPQGQNTPVGTTLAMIEQGMKVIDAVYKRIYLSLKREYQMLYRVNSIYLIDDRYKNILDDENADSESDYATGDFDIIPVGDTRISSQVMRTMKAQAARDIAMNTPGADVRAATMRVLESMDIDNPEEILPELPPAAELMAKLEELQGYAETMKGHVDTLTQQMNSSEERRKDLELELKFAKLDLEKRESGSKVAVNMATTAEKLSNTDKTQVETGQIENQSVNAVEQVAANTAINS